jgi:4-diphosphocytidyl-2-C-methyl-D-erythritol kinase
MRIQYHRNRLKIETPAKINLFLEVLDRRSDGFHELETVMLAIDLTDRLSFQPLPSPDIELSVLSPFTHSDDGAAAMTERNANGNADTFRWDVPANSSNLVHQAWTAARSAIDSAGILKKGAPAGVAIELEKRIPAQAGLGGGSSDAAAAIVAAFVLCANRWNAELMSNVAGKLGSDLNFFLESHSQDHWAAVCTGRGEIVRPIGLLNGISGVIAQPNAGCPTGKIFQSLALDAKKFHSAAVEECLATGNVPQLRQQVFNRLQSAACTIRPQCFELIESFLNYPEMAVAMTGSGSAVYGVCPDHQSASGILQSLDLDSSVFTSVFRSWRAPSIDAQLASLRYQT